MTTETNSPRLPLAAFAGRFEAGRWPSLFDQLKGGAVSPSRRPKPEKKRATRIFNLDEAAKELRKSRRWLQDWLRDHPIDAAGTPFYAPLGRTKTFSETDLERIQPARKNDAA